jgi:hypothetical protein
VLISDLNLSCETHTPLLQDRDERKRKYNSFVSSEVTPEEMEAYRMKKRNFEDPMGNISSDKLMDE